MHFSAGEYCSCRASLTFPDTSRLARRGFSLSRRHEIAHLWNMKGQRSQWLVRRITPLTSELRWSVLRLLSRGLYPTECSMSRLPCPSVSTSYSKVLSDANNYTSAHEA
jgi:hypothetical protein